MTFAEALAEGRAALSAAGVEDGAFDARLLLAAAAGLDMAALIAGSGDALSPLADAAYRSHIRRRAAGEPVARILGEAEFWGFRLKLNSATLVPRPETESLVEAVLRQVPDRSVEIRVCDLGTGSGAIVIALLRELSHASAVATDISSAALAAAEENAKAHGVGDRVAFRLADFAEGPKGRFDLVVSNPPYVATDVIRTLPREVREHDPRPALDGGEDGLDAYRTILSRVPELLAEGGILGLEVGFDQGESVAALCRRAGLADVAQDRDLGGRIRVVTARKTRHAALPRTAKKALGKLG